MRARHPTLRLRAQQAGYWTLRFQEELGLRAGADGVRIPSLPPRSHPGKQPAQSEVPGADRALAAAADRSRQRARSACREKPRVMEPLLFLAHRLPYPPNKGDKVRSYHFFKHLASRYRV